MIRPRENEKECSYCHRFIPVETQDHLCPECREHTDKKVVTLYVECENCSKPVKNGEAFHCGTLVCCSMDCKRELEKLVVLQ